MANTYPTSQYEPSPDANYTFTIYLKDGEKFHLDYFTESNARKMADLLRKDKEVFSVRTIDTEGNLHDVYAGWARD